MFKWWTFLLLGSIFLGLFILFYRKGKIKFEKLSSWEFLKTGYGLLMAVGFIVVGIVGFFVPKILSPANKYVQATQNISDIGEVLLAIFWQVAFFSAFIYCSLYKPIIKKDKSNVGVGIFLISALILSWIVVYFTGRFREYFVDPFVDLFHLIF